MMLIKRFLAGNEVRLIMQDLAQRHRIRQEGGRQWAENVGTLFPQAQRYYELLEAATAALPSEADRQAMLEAAWKEFRQLAIKLSPPQGAVAQPPPRRPGHQLDVDCIR